MNSQVLYVFYGKDCLPYKEKARNIHFPILGSAFQGASNTTQVRFYYDKIGNSDTTWVAIAKTQNGTIGSKVLVNYYDEELQENYALLELSSFYTQYQGSLFVSLQGYQGGVNVEYNQTTDIYEITGTPTIQATGSIKIAINYSTQFIGSGEIDTVDMQEILALLGAKNNIGNAIVVLNDISTQDLSQYDNGQIFYDKETDFFYAKTNVDPFYEKIEVGTGIDIENYYTKEESDELYVNHVEMVAYTEEELEEIYDE